MHIKKITISGFRSYRETNHLLDLSPGLNAVIGANGCGKTNILNAIQFVLSDEFNGLTANQRQQLINESQSQRLLMSFVEVVIDNTDRRMPLEMNEVTFRRQIGLKKDQYFINNKIITHSDIVSLLETAGFSRSNPYYIVKQGKVNEMAIASDAFRLQVMREVAGTRIYDERKAEAVKMLRECNERSEKIDDCIKSLEERLNNLMIESEDLKKYLKWDKRRRLLEYIIANKESENVKNQVLKLEDKLIDESQGLDKKRSKLQDIQNKSKECERRLKVISEVITEYRKDMKEINKKINELDEQKAKIESNIHDFKENLKFSEESDSKIKAKLKELNQLIETKKKRLVLTNAKYEELKDKENKLVCDLKAKQSRKVDLYSRLKRKNDFKTVEERNVWIKTEIPKLEKEIQSYEKRIADLKKEDYEITKNKIHLENEQKDFVKEEENLLKTLQEEKEKLCELSKRIKQMESKRSELWDSENQYKENELKLTEEKVKLENRLTKLSGTSAITGRQSVKKVLEIFEERASNSAEDESRLRPIIDGYLGQVIDCFTYDANITKAIEVTAKSKLFYHIVTNDKIGTKIIAEVNRNHLFGDITFIAINKLNLKSTKYPDYGNNARPISELIKYDNKFEKVMKFLFDRTLVCRNLELATVYARSAKMDCVTIDGDLVSHKGLMSGGYFGPETRIPLFNKWRKIEDNIESIRQKGIDCSKKKEINEKALVCNQNSLYSLDADHNKTRRKVENLKMNKDRIRQILIDLNKKQESIARTIISIQTTLPSIRATKESFESELELDLNSQLTNEEKKDLEAMTKDIDRLKAERSAICEKQNKYFAEKCAIEADLESNLEQRKNELEAALIDSKVNQDETVLRTETMDTEEIDKQIDSLRKYLDEKNQKIDQMIDKMNEQKDMIEKLKKEEDERMDQLEKEAKKSRQINVKIANLERKNEDYLTKLRTFGTVPNDRGNQYKDMSLSDNYKELQKCNQKMSKLTNVNQKALDQLTDGETKSKILVKERQTQKLGYNAIEKLIEDLENQKYEAIQLTYRQVSRFFGQIFKKLVPEGTAFIDMIYGETNGSVSSQSTQSQETQSSGGISIDQMPTYSRIDNFVGVKIRVAFTGRAAIKELNELSGGQKSIVALAFIFAIQKCDPAPFYLFDEVDHALDPSYRKTLSDIIKDLSKSSQFIITTFRPELLANADKYFGVKLRNRISHVEEITEEVAKDFVESDEGLDQSSRRKRRSVHFEDTTDE